MKQSIRRLAATLALLVALLALAPPPLAAEGRGVNLNSATESELTALPGIGPAKAKAIVAYRGSHPFRSVDEMKNVKGIGDKLFDQLKDKVMVDAVASSAAPAKH